MHDYGVKLIEGDTGKNVSSYKLRCLPINPRYLPIYYFWVCFLLVWSHTLE